jgi:isoquinoline 1-oxidoreductase subunit alpha
MATYLLHVNGQVHEVNVHDDTPLLWVLRDSLDLVGTKYGCGIAQCGACTVHVDGRPVKSCTIPVSAISDEKITTIEGLSEKGEHPVQQAWDEEDVPQCGYCQAGQVMTAVALLRENKKPTDEDIDNYMRGNLCRCGTYNRIRKAIHLAANKGGKI